MAVAVNNPNRRDIPTERAPEKKESDIDKIIKALTVANLSLGIGSDISKIMTDSKDRDRLALETENQKIQNTALSESMRRQKENILTPEQQLKLGSSYNLSSDQKPGAVQFFSEDATGKKSPLYASIKKSTDDPLKAAQIKKEEAQTKVQEALVSKYNADTRKLEQETKRIQKEATVAGIKLPDETWKAGRFALRMEKAESDINNLLNKGFDPTSFSNAVVQKRLPEYAQNEGTKLFYQAARNYTLAKNRKDSGGAITDDEIAETIKTDFPGAGDPGSVLRQKAELRNIEITALKTQGGKAYEIIKGNIGSNISNIDQAPKDNSFIPSAQAGSNIPQKPNFKNMSDDELKKYLGI